MEFMQYKKHQTSRRVNNMDNRPGIDSVHKYNQ